MHSLSYSTSSTFSKLDENTPYSVSVVAQNAAGFGPALSGSFETGFVGTLHIAPVALPIIVDEVCQFRITVTPTNSVGTLLLGVPVAVSGPVMCMISSLATGPFLSRTQRLTLFPSADVFISCSALTTGPEYITVGYGGIVHQITNTSLLINVVGYPLAPTPRGSSTLSYNSASVSWSMPAGKYNAVKYWQVLLFPSDSAAWPVTGRNVNSSTAVFAS